jgi:predicted nucleic acid-binding protein
METKLSYLLDTCILIDYLRGNASIYDLLIKDKGIHLYMSTVTMMELILGALNKGEVNYIKKAFKEIKIIYINENISMIAEDLMIKYNKSHNLQIDDALIAATSTVMNIELITYNKSDFHFIPNISLYNFNA